MTSMACQSPPATFALSGSGVSPRCRPPVSPPTMTAMRERPKTSSASSIAFVAAVFPFRRLRKKTFKHLKIVMVSSSGADSSGKKGETDDIIQDLKAEKDIPGTSFLAKLAIALGIAATITIISALSKSPAQSSHTLPQFIDSSSNSIQIPIQEGFTFTFFGSRIIIPAHTPGWVYFWLLMAAGCGLFISEEALNIWVGISLARSLSLDGSWQSLVNSFSNNASFIVSTILWVYWGVCISDMIPFYVGKFFSKTKASNNIYTKLGIGKEKAMSITQSIQKYGNLIGFVERFSLGIRNPTSFLAGALGISPECYFAGVCCGALITLPIQLAIGFLLRERPMVALASTATLVGIWTAFPYVIAAGTALFVFLRQLCTN